MALLCAGRAGRPTTAAAVGVQKPSDVHYQDDGRESAGLGAEMIQRRRVAAVAVPLLTVVKGREKDALKRVTMIRRRRPARQNNSLVSLDEKPDLGRHGEMVIENLKIV